MEDIRLNTYWPASGPGQAVGQGKTAGAARTAGADQAAGSGKTVGGQTGELSFRQALEDQLRASSDVAFSKHAVSRAIQHNLPLSDDNIARLNEGVRLAAAKNLADPLILVDRTAFLVNIKHHKVITTVDAGELKGNVFTNIDGTVII
jgi:flagellar operon protein